MTPPPSYLAPTNCIYVPMNTVVNIGDYVYGSGIQPETIVVNIINDNPSKRKVVLNKKPWTNTTPPAWVPGDGGLTPWALKVSFSSFKHGGIYSQQIKKTLSFREDVKGWVSFKSFFPESGVSMANEYYTFINGELFKHHIEDRVDRNTFYKGEVFLPFTPSSINVILNDGSNVSKSFTTLDYEGSQSKVDVFKTKTTDDFGNEIPAITDNQYFNLNSKKGWHVESIETDKEKGDLNEFIEKEGKWFNYLRGKSIETSDTNALIVNEDGSSSFDQAGFAIQGIGKAITGTIDCIYGCTDYQNFMYNPLANCDDGSCAVPASWDCIDGTCIDPLDESGWYTSLAACRADCDIPESYNCIPTATTTAEIEGVHCGCGGNYYIPTGNIIVPAGQIIYTVGDTISSIGGVIPAATTITNITYPTSNQLIITLSNMPNIPSGSWKINPPAGGFQYPLQNQITLGGGNVSSCVDPGTGDGQYTTLSECQSACLTIPESWDCDSGPGGYRGCVEVFDGQGQFATQIDCQTANICGTFDCYAGACYDPGDGSGAFSNPHDCQNACFGAESWNCDCTGLSGCSDPYDGSGTYSTLAECMNNCSSLVPGCMDPTMFNYNPLATCPDGSCVPFAYGCTDSTAFNYDSTANTDNGTCCFVQGCTDPLATNFDPTACYYQGFGCNYPPVSPCDCTNDPSCRHLFQNCETGQTITIGRWWYTGLTSTSYQSTNSCAASQLIYDKMNGNLGGLTVGHVLNMEDLWNISLLNPPTKLSKFPCWEYIGTGAFPGSSNVLYLQAEFNGNLIDLLDITKLSNCASCQESPV